MTFMPFFSRSSRAARLENLETAITSFFFPSFFNALFASLARLGPILPPAPKMIIFPWIFSMSFNNLSDGADSTSSSSAMDFMAFFMNKSVYRHCTKRAG